MILSVLDCTSRLLSCIVPFTHTAWMRCRCCMATEYFGVIMASVVICTVKGCLLEISSNVCSVTSVGWCLHCSSSACFKQFEPAANQFCILHHFLSKAFPAVLWIMQRDHLSLDEHRSYLLPTASPFEFQIHLLLSIKSLSVKTATRNSRSRNSSSNCTG